MRSGRAYSPLATALEVALTLVSAVVAIGLLSVAYDQLAGTSGRPPWGFVVLVALVVAVALPRLRTAIRRWLNRRIFGREAGGLEMMSEFITRVAATLDIDDVLPRLAEAAARTAHGMRGEVSVNLADGTEWRQAWPAVLATPADPGGPGGQISVSVAHHGDIVGAIQVGGGPDEIARADREVLADLAAPAGVALATVRLTVELRRRVEDLAAVAADLARCRSRMVAARTEEQALVLDRIRSAVFPPLQEAAADLGVVATDVATPERLARAASARAHLEASLDALRLVSRGIFPPVLSGVGIEGALRSLLVERFGASSLTIEGDVTTTRDHPAVESALYVACSSVLEAVGRADLVLVSEPTGYTISASWDSPAPIAPRRLQSIADRIGALGGQIRESPSQLTVSVPIAVAAVAAAAAAADQPAGPDEPDEPDEQVNP